MYETSFPCVPVEDTLTRSVEAACAIAAGKSAHRNATRSVNPKTQK